MFTRILIAGAVSALIGLIYFGIINIPAIKRNIGKVPHWVGILVVIAAGRVFEPMVTTAWEAFQLPTQTESALLEVAVFRTIKEQEPKLFQEILQRAIEALRKDRKASLTPITAKYCTKLVLSRIPHADDRAIIEYMRSTMDITRYLDSRSHDQAFAYLFPDRVQYKLPFLADLPKERLERQLGALNGVLVSSFGKQRTIPTETEVQPIMIDVLTGIRDRCDISIFSKLDRQDLDHAETLRTLLAYYDGLFALQEPQAGAVLRYSLAQ
jgi:hypothetical protein